MKVLVFIAIFAVFAFANVAKVAAVIGDAELLRDGKSYEVELGALLEQEDTIQTKANAKVQVIFEDNTIVTVGRNASLYIKDYLYDASMPSDSRADLHFMRGAFEAITGNIAKINKKKFKLRTKNATIGIRGTTVLANQEVIACIVGEIEVEYLSQRVRVRAEHFTQINDDKRALVEQKLLKEQFKRLEDEIEPLMQNSTSHQDSLTETKPSRLVIQKALIESRDLSIKETLAMQTILRNEYETKRDALEKLIYHYEPIDPDPVDPDPIDPDPIDPDPVDPDPIDPEPIATVVHGTSLSVLQSADSTNSKRYIEVLNGDIKGDVYTLNGQSIEEFSDPLLEDKELEYSKKYTLSESFDPQQNSGFQSYNEVLHEDLFLARGEGYTGESILLADNMGEVFITSTDGYYLDAPMQELFVTGVDAPLALMDTQAYYIYDNLQSLTVKQIDDGHFYGDLQSSLQRVYYNPNLHSYTVVEKSATSSLGSQASFFAGNSTGISSLKHSYVSENITGGLSYIQQTTTEEELLQSSFKGSEFQALTLSVSGEQEGVHFVDDFEVKKDYETLSVYTLADKNTYDYSGDYELSGFLSGRSMRTSNYSYNNSSGSFKMHIDRENGVFSTQEFYYDELGLSVEGRVEDRSAYYVNDDLFGSLLSFSENGKYSGFEGLDMVDESAYMVSIPDGAIVDEELKLYDLNDNPLMSDDESSWGYWTAAFEEDEVLSGHIDTQSVWVAGTKTSQEYVQTLLDDDEIRTYNFVGKVLGGVDLANASGYEQIKMDASNHVDLAFDFGGGTGSMRGNIAFETQSTAWDLAIDEASSSVYSEGFYGSLGAITAGGDTGFLEGAFYGSDDIKSVGGNFGATNSNYDSANGVFKATK